MLELSCPETQMSPMADANILLLTLQTHIKQQKSLSPRIRNLKQNMYYNKVRGNRVPQICPSKHTLICQFAIPSPSPPRCVSLSRGHPCGWSWLCIHCNTHTHLRTNTHSEAHRYSQHSVTIITLISLPLLCYIHTHAHTHEHHLLYWCHSCSTAPSYFLLLPQMVPPPNVPSTHPHIYHYSQFLPRHQTPNLLLINGCCLTASLSFSNGAPSPQLPPPPPPQYKPQNQNDTVYTSMHGERVDMPCDGALPMLRHGPLQLQVIAFPVSPPLFSFFPPPSSCPSPSVFFSKCEGSPCWRRSPCVGSLLSLSCPPSLCLSLSPAFSLPSAGTSFTRWLWSSGGGAPWQHCACVPASTGVRERVRAGEVDGENLREREREKYSLQLLEFAECQKKPNYTSTLPKTLFLHALFALTHDSVFLPLF